ncbi:DUF5317 family protein [Nocardioides sp. NPDC058538]|uniref:DUF5317 family protein n=1 Tax=Nocardioides sp. NPDC058538 TaxID=3346542 RepID=UPI0036662516
MPGPGMLTLMVLPAVIGLIIVARPNVATSLTSLRGKWLIVLVAALEFMHVEGLWPGWVEANAERRAYSVLVVVIAIAFCWLNRSLWSHRSGRWALSLIPLGTVSNSVPIAVLGAMPYSVSGARAAGYSSAELATDASGYIRLDDVSQLWIPLADLIPVPVLMKVLSIGDLLLFPGLALLIVACFQPSASDRSVSDARTNGSAQPSA